MKTKFRGLNDTDHDDTMAHTTCTCFKKEKIQLSRGPTGVVDQSHTRLCVHYVHC